MAAVRAVVLVVVASVAASVAVGVLPMSQGQELAQEQPSGGVKSDGELDGGPQQQQQRRLLDNTNNHRGRLDHHCNATGECRPCTPEENDEEACMGTGFKKPYVCKGKDGAPISIYEECDGKNTSATAFFIFEVVYNGFAAADVSKFMELHRTSA